MAENKDKKVLNVPNIRFKEFKEEWEKCRLGEIATIVGGGTPDTNNSVFWNGSIQWFTPSEVGKNKYISHSIRKISEEGLKKSSAKLLPIGTILLSSRATIGECSINTIECTTNQGFESLIINQDNYNEFFFYLIQTKRKELIRKSCGSTFLEISSNEIKKINITKPSRKEQEKIANFLSLIDERIATQNKIIEELKQLKNGISSNLLTNRSIFDKQITLSDCGTLKNGYAFKSSTYDLKGKYSIITIANVTGARFIESVDCNKVTKIPEDIQPHQILCYGDILISLTGNVGRVSLCTDGHFLLNQRVGLFELSDSIDKEFIYQVLSSKHFENEMIAKGQGAAQMNINKNDVESYVIPYSTNIQNIRIVSSLLKSLDEKILTMEHLLLSYDKQKQHLLRQMFI